VVAVVVEDITVMVAEFLYSVTELVAFVVEDITQVVAVVV
jgi:hypothetical protein